MYTTDDGKPRGFLMARNLNVQPVTRKMRDGEFVAVKVDYLTRSQHCQFAMFYADQYGREEKVCSWEMSKEPKRLYVQFMIDVFFVPSAACRSGKVYQILCFFSVLP